MVSLAGSKGTFMGLILVVVYASWILDIIQILKTHQNRSNNYKYPPAVIPMLVAALLQSIYCLWYLMRGGKGALFKASTIAAAFLFFTLFQLGSVIAFTILRYGARYCPPEATSAGCRGATRGTMGLGYSVVGLNLLYLVYLAMLVKKFGNWSKDLWNIPERRHANADFDKAPAH